MDVGTQIMLLRERKGLSREQMSDILGMHVNTYKNIEYGKKIPDLNEIQIISKALDVPATLFLHEGGSSFFQSISNSPGTGIGNLVVNDKELLTSLVKSIGETSPLTR